MKRPIGQEQEERKVKKSNDRQQGPMRVDLEGDARTLETVPTRPVGSLHAQAQEMRMRVSNPEFNTTQTNNSRQRSRLEVFYGALDAFMFPEGHDLDGSKARCLS